MQKVINICDHCKEREADYIITDRTQTAPVEVDGMFGRRTIMGPLTLELCKICLRAVALVGLPIAGDTEFVRVLANNGGFSGRVAANADTSSNV